MTAQEWFQKMHELNTSIGRQPVPDDPNDPLEAVAGHPLSGDIRNFSYDDISIYYGRAVKWRTAHFNEKPDGKPALYISADHIAAMYNPMPMRSAERILDNIRFFFEKPNHANITVNEYRYIMSEMEDDKAHGLVVAIQQPSKLATVINVQEWLQSLNGVSKLRGYEPLPDDPNNPLEAVPGLPLSGDLNNLDTTTLNIIVTRAAKFRLRYGDRQPNKDPGSTDRRYISYKDIMALHVNMPIRSAKRILASIRFFIQKPPTEKITVKLYCIMTGKNEEDTQMTLQELHEQLKIKKPTP